MATDIILRSVKAAALTHAEMDQNWESAAMTVDAKTANYTVLVADQNKLFEMNGSSITLMLPTVSNAGGTDTDSFKVRVTNINATTLTIDGNGSETIDGATTFTLNQYESCTISLDSGAAAWSVLNHSDYDRKGADIASATTTDIGAATGQFIDITGTTTITGLGDIRAGIRRTVQFDDALILTYNATSLILPGDANITTVAGDTAEFISAPGTGRWLCTQYTRGAIIPPLEGTWTPTLQDNSLSDSESQTYGTTTASYTRLGSRVFISGVITMTSLGTLTTSENARIAGLPFTVGNNSGDDGGITIYRSNGLAITSGTSVSGLAVASSTVISLVDWDDVGGSKDLAISQVTASGSLYFIGQYLV